MQPKRESIRGDNRGVLSKVIETVTCVGVFTYRTPFSMREVVVKFRFKDLFSSSLGVNNKVDLTGSKFSRI